jgi:GNAT superfamily N-acetyltransferase
MSYPLKTDKEFEDYNLLVLKQSKVLYIFSFVVNHRYQGKGYGKTLLNDIIKTAREKDYDYVAGHFKIGGSYEIFKRYGPVVVDTFKDWEGSGHDYNFCVLELKGEETWEK